MSAAARVVETPPDQVPRYEAGLVGVAIRSRELLGPDLCGVTFSDLAIWKHRLVFEAASAAAASGPIDVTLVAAELERRGQLDVVGGIEFLDALVGEAPFGEPLARSYAARVREASDGRRLVVALADATAIQEERGPVAGGRFARDRLEELARRTHVDQLAQIRAALVADLEAGPEAIDAAQPPMHISKPRFPVAGACIAAPGKTGKTTLVLGEMVHVAADLDLYGDPIDMPGQCVYVSAEDGAHYPQYLLQRILADGRNLGALSERAATIAKSGVRIIGWSRSKFGPLMRADESGETHVCAVWPLLLELLAPLKPVYVTLDPSVLFGPGERFGNDASAAFAALMHETAQQIGAVVQTIDHVAQAVARGGIVDQYASRGGTGKIDESRLARQLVPVTGDAAEPMPAVITPADVTERRVLQLHWTKTSYAPLPPPAWLRRRGYWFEYLRAPSVDETASASQQEREKQIVSDTAAIVAHVRAQLAVGAGIRYTRRDLDDHQRPVLADGSAMTRQRVRDAVRYAVATRLLIELPLPEGERQGSRKSYLAPGDNPR